MRRQVRYALKDPEMFKNRLLFWAQGYEDVIWLDSNGHTDPFSRADGLMALGAAEKHVKVSKASFKELANFQQKTGDWLFGYLSYDLKNDIEALHSNNKDGLNFPEIYFFRPKKVIKIKGNTAEFLYLEEVEEDLESDFESINSSVIAKPAQPSEPLKISMRIFKDEYFRKVDQLLAHIHRGDIYEINFCQEFYSEGAQIDPIHVYNRLNEISLPPFAAYLKLGHQYVLSASPERFLCKRGRQIISQPIKGTARRSDEELEDRAIKQWLETDIKERAENIMIVDLVRNDLSKKALRGSVEVVELCKVYSYPQVHQMVSTVTASVSDDVSPVEVIRECFPMGSMTGAPKVSAMKLIEKYESSKRGVYSGAIGYFTPENDFDFNVVIRSILYNSQEKYLSFSVGSAITARSVPENEYQECLLKARAMRSVLSD